MPINIISELVAKNNGQFAILDDTAIRGGFRIVANLTERNNIPSDKRKAGMRVAVCSTDIVYKLNNDMSTWSIDNALTQSLQSAYNNGSVITTINDVPVLIQGGSVDSTIIFQIKNYLGSEIFKASNNSQVEFTKQLIGKDYMSSLTGTIPTNSSYIILDKFDKSTYRAIQYFYTVSNSDGSGFETGQIFIVHNGLSATIEHVVGVSVGTSCGISFTVDMLAYDINLRATTDNSGLFSRVVNLFRIALI